MLQLFVVAAAPSKDYNLLAYCVLFLEFPGFIPPSVQREVKVLLLLLLLLLLLRYFSEILIFWKNFKLNKNCP